MSKPTTTNLGLVKPSEDELVSISDINGNMDKIESAITSDRSRISDLEGKATSVSVEQVKTSGIEIAKITIDGDTKSIYQQDGDDKVYQSKVSDNQERPLLMAYCDPGDTANPTGQVRWASKMYANASTGVVTAPKFKGNLEGHATSAGTALSVEGTVATADEARRVWFSWSGDNEPKRAYDDDFKYNPATNVLTVGSITGYASRTVQNQSSATAVPVVYVGSNNVDTTLLRVYSSDQNDANYRSAYGYSLKYIGTGSGNANYLKLYADNTNAASQVLAIAVDQAGRVGIKGEPSTSYAFNVTGDMNATGIIKQNGTAVSLDGHTHEYLPLTGGTLTGPTIIQTENGNYNEGLRIHRAPSGWSTILLGATRNTSTQISDGWFIGRNPNSQLVVSKKDSTAATALFYGSYANNTHTLSIPHILEVKGNTTGPIVRKNPIYALSSCNNNTSNPAAAIYWWKIATVTATNTSNSTAVLNFAFNDTYRSMDLHIWATIIQTGPKILSVGAVCTSTYFDAGWASRIYAVWISDTVAEVWVNSGRTKSDGTGAPGTANYSSIIPNYAFSRGNYHLWDYCVALQTTEPEWYTQYQSKLANSSYNVTAYKAVVNPVLDGDASYLKTTGGTISGNLAITGNLSMSNGSFSGPDGITFSDYADYVQEGVNWNYDGSHKDSLISYQGDLKYIPYNTGGTIAANGDKVYSVIHTGNLLSLLPSRLQEVHGSYPHDAGDAVAITNGFHYITTSNNVTSPFKRYHPSNEDYMVISNNYSNRWGSQIATDFRTNKMLVRNHNDNTWNQWAQVESSADWGFVETDNPSATVPASPWRRLFSCSYATMNPWSTWVLDFDIWDGWYSSAMNARYHVQLTSNGTANSVSGAEIACVHYNGASTLTWDNVKLVYNNTSKVAEVWAYINVKQSQYVFKKNISSARTGFFEDTWVVSTTSAAALPSTGYTVVNPTIMAQYSNTHYVTDSVNAYTDTDADKWAPALEFVDKNRVRIANVQPWIGTSQNALCLVVNTKANASVVVAKLWQNGWIDVNKGITTPKLRVVSTQNLSGVADNRPALVVGGTETQPHMEIDANEIQAKSNGTSTAPLYLNWDGGAVNAKALVMDNGVTKTDTSNNQVLGFGNTQGFGVVNSGAKCHWKLWNIGGQNNNDGAVDECRYSCLIPSRDNHVLLGLGDYRLNHVFTKYINGYTLGAACAKAIVDTNGGTLNWTGDVATNGGNYVPTVKTMAYWNGCYTGTNSNITHCKKGALGDACIKGVDTSVASGSTSTNLPTTKAVAEYAQHQIGYLASGTLSGGSTGDVTVMPDNESVGSASKPIYKENGVYKECTNISTGTVTSIKVNGTTKSPTNGLVDLGTIGELTSVADTSATSAIADGGFASVNWVNNLIATLRSERQWVRVYYNASGLTSGSGSLSNGGISNADYEVKIVTSSNSNWGMSSTSIIIKDTGFRPSSSILGSNYSNWNAIHIPVADGTDNAYEIAVQFTSTTTFSIYKNNRARLHAIYVRRA